MKLSVVIPTYNRAPLLRRLLLQFSAQTLPNAQFEVVVVDDGSRPAACESVGDLRPPYAFRLIRQENAGAAAARHAGILAARGELVLVIDDDMQIGRDFLEQHLRAHADGGSRVVLGRIHGDPDVSAMPLFERWHARLLDRKAEEIRSGKLVPRGNLLFTGNASFPRRDYLAVGGFDASLGQSEDIELGLRLEKAGATFHFCEAAWTMHGSDHTNIEKWRERARRYGTCDRRIAARHPEFRHASPWRFAFDLHPLTRPFIGAALLAPRGASAIAGVALRMAALLAWFGLERAAMAGTSFAYALEYFRGVREGAGSREQASRELADFAERFETNCEAVAPPAPAALAP
jgi:glycosyltransferase involved in cell wall biosynthesis